MRLLRDESDQASERLADVNRAFEPPPGEQAAAWERLHQELQPRWDADRARAERRQARRAAWRLLFGAGSVATLVLIVWVVVRPRATDEIAQEPIAREVTPAVSPPGAVAPRRGVGSPPRATTPAPDVRPPQSAPPVAVAPGRSWLAAGVRARLAPRAEAMVRSGAIPTSRVVSLLRGRIDIDIDIVDLAAAPGAAPGPSGGGASAAPALAAAPSPVPSRVEVQVASYRLEPDPGRFSVRARGDKVDVVVHSGKLAVWSSRRLLATVVAGQRWTNLGSRGSGRLPPASSDDGVRDEATGVAAPAAQEPDDAPGLESRPDGRSSAGTDGPDCARLTRDGDIDGALACFARSSEQPGLVGELALMELARIRRDVKGDLAGAERALAEHRRRFPRGALANEAAGARVELLVRLARPVEALAETSHLGGGEAVFWRAVCLAKLGRSTEAARGFDEYLARPEGKRRAEAERMRRELAP
jgi:hypothetical protein